MKQLNRVLLLLAPVVCPAAEPSWPQFLGPGRDCVSTETGLMKEWPENGPELLWTYSKCGRGYASVTVVDGRIFTAGDFGDTLEVLALGPDGKLLWSTPNGRSWRSSTPGARATPTISDATAYHMNAFGRVAALDAKSGTERWAVELSERFQAQRITWGLAESVLVDDERVYCAPGCRNAALVALDKKTGETVWVCAELADRTSYSSPILVAHKGVRQIIALAQRSVVGVAADSGKLLWEHEHPSPYHQNSTTPVYHNGYVFVASGHQAGGRMLRINDDSSAAEEVWFSKDIDNCHNGVLVLGNHLYGSGCRLYKKGFLCVELETGKTTWSHPPLGKVSIVYVDGLLHGLDQLGNMSISRISPAGCETISMFSIEKESRDQVLAYPVVCGGRLYIRHAHNLFCYSIEVR